MSDRAILALSVAYLAALFLIAWAGDRRPAGRRAPVIYPLALGIYCTSWTYFGSVGIASRSGFDFLPIYIGPILVFALGWPLLQRIAEIAKRQNIASIADFLSARYGKSEALGALVAAVATIGVVPYISIQLKAVSQSLQTLITDPLFPEAIMPGVPGSDGLSMLVALTMGVFAILFGPRHIDNTEHQDGMILAISVESIVKLVAFVAVGLFVSTLTEQPMAATITVMIVVILSWVLDGVPQVAWLHPWLIVHEWMSFGDLLRDPVSLDGAGRGLWVALGYAVVFLAAAWARLSGKDITS